MFKHILKDYPGFEESRILMLFWKQIQVLKRNQIVFWQSQHGCNGGRSGVGIYGGNLSWIFTSNGPTLPCLKYIIFSFLKSSFFLTHFITQQLKDSYPLGLVVRFDPSINWRHVRVACFQLIRSMVFYTWLILQKKINLTSLPRQEPTRMWTPLDYPLPWINITVNFGFEEKINSEFISLLKQKAMLKVTSQTKTTPSPSLTWKGKIENNRHSSSWKDGLLKEITTQ